MVVGHDIAEEDIQTVDILCLMSPQLGSATTRVSQSGALKPTREFWLFNLSYKEHKLMTYKRLIIRLAGRVLNNLCQPLTGNYKTRYTILYTDKNEIYRKQETIHKVI